jgi:hypothetical protein
VFDITLQADIVDFISKILWLFEISRLEGNFEHLTNFLKSTTSNNKSAFFRFATTSSFFGIALGIIKTEKSLAYILNLLQS